jgi:hypothetical protein
MLLLAEGNERGREWTILRCPDSIGVTSSLSDENVSINRDFSSIIGATGVLQYCSIYVLVVVGVLLVFYR